MYLLSTQHFEGDQLSTRIKYVSTKLGLELDRYGRENVQCARQRYSRKLVLSRQFPSNPRAMAGQVGRFSGEYGVIGAGYLQG